MRFAIILFVVAATSGCGVSVDCGPGTIERNGTCEPSDVSTGTAKCGAGTVLVGDQCLTTVACDPNTTMAVPDPSDPSKTVCVGSSGGKVDCSQALPCPTPAAGKQTICGQLYDIQTNAKFAATGADGSTCDGTATSGPCALSVNAYDALAYGNSPTTTTPLANGGTYIDNCGRYEVKDITLPTTPFIGLGFDDAAPANMGAGGVTNTTGVATNATADASTSGLEAWVAPKSTTDMWTPSGPPVSGGIYVAIFRTHKCDAAASCGATELAATQSGVTITYKGSPVPNNDYYFTAGEMTHQTIDASATATGANGTGLLTGASVNDLIVYSGTGGINDTVNCKWEAHAAASLPNIVFFQVYRPQNQIGKQCAQ